MLNCYTKPHFQTNQQHLIKNDCQFDTKNKKQVTKCLKKRIFAGNARSHPRTFGHWTSEELYFAHPICL